MLSLQEYQTLASHLQGIRQQREADWMELSGWICPYRGRLPDKRTDRPHERKAMERFTHIAANAVLRGASGMTSGMTPRNTNWFKPAFTDEQLMEIRGARQWLDSLDQRIRDCLSAGGFYQAILNFNLDLIWAGCALLYTEKSGHIPLRFETQQIGTFLIGRDAENKLDTVIRTLSLTPVGLAQRFGEDKLLQSTRQKLKTAPYEEITIWHCVKREGSSYPSVYWEENGKDFLRVSRYYEMPFFFTSWHEGKTPYGSGPGDDCYPDARQIDVLERRKLAGLELLVNPPVACPPSLKEVADLAPGAINYVSQNEIITPIMNLQPYAAALQNIQAEILTVSRRLEQGLMAAIFSSTPLDQRPRDMSATEFLERKREMLQQLGPVISAYEPDVLIPMLFRIVRTLDRAGLTPPPPQELAGIPIYMKIDFISPMSNALRKSSAETARALFADIAAIFQATGKNEIFDKIDLDQMTDELATGYGAPGSIIRSDQEVAAIRQQRAQIQTQQALIQQQIQSNQIEQQNMKTAEQAAKTQSALQEVERF